MEALLVADEIVAVLLVVVVGSPRGAPASMPAFALSRPPRPSPSCFYAGRDGNGYPKPETRWVFASLGCGHRLNSIPAGFLMG